MENKGVETYKQVSKQQKALKQILHAFAAKYQVPFGMQHEPKDLSVPAKLLLTNYFKEQPTALPKNEYDFLFNRMTKNRITEGITPQERLKLSEVYPEDIWLDGYQCLKNIITSPYSSEESKNVSVNFVKEIRPIISAQSQELANDIRFILGD